MDAVRRDLSNINIQLPQTQQLAEDRGKWRALTKLTSMSVSHDHVDMATVRTTLVDTNAPAYLDGLDRIVSKMSMNVPQAHVSMEAVQTKMVDTIVPVTMDGLEQTVSKGGWSEYNNYCYKLFKDKVSWSTANERCKQHGANLASVGSAGENNFIARLITDGG
ncbi:hypothetical protein Bbelb_272180 [Branchiostoma belcheri]|nr:hypothetical protein Bbelb_272180 [Branchiostoma belcheri]